MEDKKQDTKDLKKDKNLNIAKIIIVSLSLMVLIYFIYIICTLLKSPSSTEIIENGQINEKTPVVGYIVRDEQVIEKEEQYSITKIKGDTQKVAKNDTVFKYITEDEETLSEQIKQIDQQINEVLKTQDITLSSNINSFDTQIDGVIQKITNIDSTSLLDEYYKEINNILNSKVIQISKEQANTSQLKQLINKRISLKTSIDNTSKYGKSPISGLVSYRIDGYEDKLKFDNIDELDYSYLNTLPIQTGQLISTKEEAKVISSFNQRIVTFIDNCEDENYTNINVGNKVTIQTNFTSPINAKIEQITDDGDRKKIVLSFNEQLEELSKYRKINFDIIWWEAKGLTISNDALLTEGDLSYVIRNRNSYKKKILVKVVKQNDKYSIIRNYTEDELKKLGYSASQIMNMSNIVIYDEVYLEPQKYIDEISS